MNPLKTAHILRQIATKLENSHNPDLSISLDQDGNEYDMIYSSTLPLFDTAEAAEAVKDTINSVIQGG